MQLKNISLALALTAFSSMTSAQPAPAAAETVAARAAAIRAIQSCSNPMVRQQAISFFEATERSLMSVYKSTPESSISPQLWKLWAQDFRRAETWCK